MPHYFWRRNEVPPHDFFRKTWWFFSEWIMRRLILCWRNSEVLPLFWWNNKEVRGLVTSTILLIMLFLQKKNQVPDYFFRKKSSALWFPNKNFSTLSFYRNKWSAPSLLFFQIKIKCLIISSEKNHAPHYCFWKESRASLFFQKKELIFFWRNNEVLDFFLKK